MAALVRSEEEAHKVASTLSGRYVSVWTTEEIARIVSHHPEIIQVKQVFPGAKVVRIRSRNSRDEAGLNDPIPQKSKTRGPKGPKGPVSGTQDGELVEIDPRGSSSKW